jgi:phosphoribosylaminoimidazolecarboxamide formyltransferase/IMP cyclohydrolase
MGIYTFGDIPSKKKDPYNLKWIDGGFMLQTGDNDIENGFDTWQVVTKKKPSAKQISQMKTAWKFISKIRSNAVIVIDKRLPMTRGIGSGQTSRLRSTKIAIEQAKGHTTDAILASDSFFPFDDSIKLAQKAGIAAIVQQGGSINDKASIETADKTGLSMIFTGRRAFWH